MRRIAFATNLLLVVVLLAGGCAREKKAITVATPAERGRETYGRLCATCHGVSGNGYVADNAPSLRSTTFLATATDAFLEAAILRGRPGTAMGAYAQTSGGPVGPREASDLIAFVREGGPPLEPLAPPQATPTPGDATRGGVVYEKFCQRCHGTRDQRVSAIHLANSVLLETASDAFLRRAIEAGRPPTSMAAWKGALTPEQIDDVVAYVRSMAVRPPPPAPSLPPAAPRKGPIVINPRGRHPDFVLRDDRFVSIDQVKAALDQKRRMIIADARGPAEWATLRIAGAISTPYYDAKSLDDIPNDGTWVLAYCACPHHVSGEVVDALRKRGYKHTAVIDEGVFAWQQKGYPVVTAPGTPAPPKPPPPPAPAPPPPSRAKRSPQ